MAGLGEKCRWVLAPSGQPNVDWQVTQRPPHLDGTPGMELITYWNATLLGPKPTQAQIDAVTDDQVAAGKAQATNTYNRANASAIYDGTIPEGVLHRAILLELVNKLNQIYGRFTPAIRATDLPTLISEVKAVIDSGQVDNPP